jgi:hypothetical protein
MGMEQVGALVQSFDTPRHFASGANAAAPPGGASTDGEAREYDTAGSLGCYECCPDVDLESQEVTALNKDALMCGTYPWIFATDFIFVFGVSFTITVMRE